MTNFFAPAWSKLGILRRHQNPSCLYLRAQKILSFLPQARGALVDRQSTFNWELLSSSYGLLSLTCPGHRHLSRAQSTLKSDLDLLACLEQNSHKLGVRISPRRTELIDHLPSSLSCSDPSSSRPTAGDWDLCRTGDFQNDALLLHHRYMLLLNPWAVTTGS